MKKVIQKLFYNQSDYVRNALTLLSGTAGAQLILIAITPILSRLYSPKDFGTLTLVLSIVNILSIISTGRYELAILLPKNLEWSKHLIKLVFLLSLIFCLTLYLPIILFKNQILNNINLHNLAWLIYVIPVLIFVNVNLASVIYLVNKERDYRTISINKIVESSAVAFFNIGLGVVSYSKGLIIGRGLGQLTAFLLFLKYLKRNKIDFWSFSRKKLSFVAKRYIKFPKFLIIAHFFNTAAFEFPAILLNNFFGSTVLGFYGFANRIASAPLSIMSISLGNVFRERAARDFIEKGECKEIYKKTLLALIKLSLIPFIIFWIFAPDIFAFIFGNKWYNAGLYARYLTPMYFFQFLSNPLSSLFMIAEKQEADLIWQVCLFCSNIAILLFGAYFLNIKLTLISFSISYSIMYLINLFLTYRYSQGHINK